MPFEPKENGLKFSRRQTVAALAPAIIILVVVAAYGNCFGGLFFFDDNTGIVENPTIRRLWPLWDVVSPTGRGVTVQGRPLVNLSLAVNYAIGGTNVFGYHVFNLAVHLINALLLCGIVRRTLLMPQWGEEINNKSTMLALAVAVLWGTHPLTTMAVTYVIQRAESLMAMFYLMTLYCAIRSWSYARGIKWEALAVISCWLGMACKEVMVSAPAMVLVYDWLFVAGSFKESLRQRKGMYLGMAASWLLLLWLVIGQGGRGGTAGFAVDMTWREYGLSQLVAVANYIRLCFWPSPLIFDYGVKLVKDWWVIGFGTAVVVSMILATALSFLSRRTRWAGYLGLFYFAVLAPSSSFVPIITQIMGEQRMYLPLAAITALAVIMLNIYIKDNRIQAMACITAVVILGTLTYRRNELYHDSVAFWSDVVNKRPDNIRAYVNRGIAYHDGKQYDMTIKDYNMVIAIDPSCADGYYNLGLVYFEMGQYSKALPYYKKACDLKPDEVKYLYNCAWLLATAPEDALRDAKLAVELAERACRLSGRHRTMLAVLAAACAETGCFADAVAAANEALTQAKAAGDSNLANVIESNLKLYKSGQPYHGGK